MIRPQPTTTAVHAETPLRPRQPVARRRSGSALTRAANLARVLAVVGMPLAATGWFATSPLFALHEIEILGTERIGRDWVEDQLHDLEGRHLLSISLDDVAGRLTAHAWLDRVAIRKQLPDRLTVELAERRPVLLLRQQDELWWVDRQGSRIAPWEPDLSMGDLPIVVWADAGPVPTAEALALVEELAAVRPAWAAELSELELLGDGDVCIFTAALPWALLLRRGQIALGIARLEAALPAIRELHPRPASFDLRFARRIVVHPLTDPVPAGV